MKLLTPLAVVGCGGHGRAVMQVARDVGYVYTMFLDDTVVSDEVSGKTDKIFDKELQRRYEFVVAIGDNHVRQRLGVLADIGGARFATLIHPLAAVDYRRIGPGTVVFPTAVVGGNASVGSWCIIDNGATVAHDCEIANCANISCRAVLGGHVRVGPRAFIGLNATILPGVYIGADVVIGAGTVVLKDALEGTWVGNPARRIK